MKITTLFMAALSGLFLTGCSQNENIPTKAAPVYTIDLQQQNDPVATEHFLSNMEIRLLPLETKDSMYFNGEEAIVHLAGNQLFIHDVAQSKIFRFDNRGKFINLISHKGQGPEEYNVLFNIAIANNTIYGLDRKKIQLYDFEGNYLKSIPLKHEGRQIAVKNDGTIITAVNYLQPFQMSVYHPDGHISDFLPSNPDLQKLQVSQSTYHSLKNNGKTFYTTTYFDHNIYQLKDDSVSIAATFDFGSKNIPSDFLTGNAEEISSRFREYRENDKAVLKIDQLTVTDDWVVFSPSLFKPSVIYYNRKTNTYIINENFEEPYNLFFGEYNAPDGYNPDTREFYRLVNAQELKEVVSEIQKENPEYLQKYPFLANVNPEQINENSNDWVIFFKL